MRRLASDQEMVFAVPASTRSSLERISADQAASASGSTSVSRLWINSPARAARSSVDNRSASASSCLESITEVYYDPNQLGSDMSPCAHPWRPVSFRCNMAIQWRGRRRVGARPIVVGSPCRRVPQTHYRKRASSLRGSRSSAAPSSRRSRLRAPFAASVAALAGTSRIRGALDAGSRDPSRAI